MGVVFRHARVVDVATYDEPRRHPEGIVGVWVNGRRVVDAAGSTAARPGRALRRP